MRIGHGYDVHRLVEGRDLILGGVKIDYEKGLLGHSDADVLLHAVSDALLGAAGLGDIGRHFPDTDPQSPIPNPHPHILTNTLISFLNNIKIKDSIPKIFFHLNK